MNWCKLGIHDWEEYGDYACFSRVWNKWMLKDKVCLRCGKKSLKASNYRHKEELEYSKKEERYNKARELWNKK